MAQASALSVGAKTMQLKQKSTFKPIYWNTHLILLLSFDHSKINVMEMQLIIHYEKKIKTYIHDVSCEAVTGN